MLWTSVKLLCSFPPFPFSLPGIKMGNGSLGIDILHKHFKLKNKMPRCLVDSLYQDHADMVVQF